MADVALVKSGLEAELARLRAEKAKHVEQLRQQGAAVAKGKGQEQAVRKLTEALRRKSAQLGTLREFQSKSDAVLGDTSGLLGSVMQRLEQAVQTQAVQTTPSPSTAWWSACSTPPARSLPPSPAVLRAPSRWTSPRPSLVCIITNVRL